MATIITTYGENAGLQSRGNSFETLARSIIGQQISVKAANSIEAKVKQAIGGLGVDNFTNTPEELLRSCGLSGQKVKYLYGLVEAEATGHFEPHHWEQDEAYVKDHLTQLKGIGPWTAEMFMIFHLLKPDIWPLGDVGLQKALKTTFSAETPKQMAAVGQRFAPYRSVATWYLWRSLDPVPVAY